MRLRIAKWCAPLATGAWLVVQPAHAQDPELDRARALYEEAGEEEKAGRWGAAQERLRAAIRIHETPHLRYALGWALENDGRIDEARSEYRTAFELAQAAGNAEVKGLAQGRLDALDRRARRVATTPTAQSAESPRDQEGARSSVVPWLLVGGGAVLGITGVALFASSSGDASARDEATRQWCTATACNDTGAATLPETPEAEAYRREAVRASDRGNEKQIIGGLCIGIGVVGAAVGTFLLLRDDKPSKRASFGASPTKGGAAVSALVSF